MKIQSLFLFSFLAILSLSCEETIRLDLDQTEPLVVIEGLVTNKPGYNYVKITKTSQFYDQGSAPAVTGAIVDVRDIEGSIVRFEERLPGFYFPPENFAGKIGDTYTLDITADGKTYQASETILPVNPFDSLTYWKPPNLDDDDAIEKEQFYELLVYYTEPQDQENYYLFKFYRNEELLDFEGTAIFAYDDEALSENIDGIATPDYYAIGDTGRIELFSITKTAFRYYRDLGNNLNNDGGLFSGIPSNAITNLSGGAIGYFQASAMESIQVTIKD